ncbi:MAG TPA: hypothetical protein DCE71_02890, partial [Parachlamydiales bacterium]|nr:hypothetical protein [Parachlamydiales bacterium]
MLFNQLDILNQKLLSVWSLPQRIALLDQEMQAAQFSPFRHLLQEKLRACTEMEKWLLGQLIVIGQARGLEELGLVSLQRLCSQLKPVDQFYREIGGIIGYQIEVLRRLNQTPGTSFQGSTFYSPCFYDISHSGIEVEDAVECGLKALPYTAEFYPLGGAADRLHLVDRLTGGDLPAAKMQFAGRSLFEGLIRDVQAREFLYEQKYGKKIVMPIGIMTSAEKDNHKFILEMCESNKWFGRPQDTFRLFCQPLVPAVDERGDWIWAGEGKLFLKPGGHGALWKMARDEGIFSWLHDQKIQQVMVRQVNNPLAGVDSGLLAFLGLGVKHNMSFGFVSCP